MDEKEIIYVVVLDQYKLMGRKHCEFRYVSSSGNYESLKYQAKLRDITLTPISFDECINYIKKNLTIKWPEIQPKEEGKSHG